MKQLLPIIILATFLNPALHAIGFQHGVFRSQSTQGPAWQGSSTIIKEHFNITVLPDYLDVELEWVFDVGGRKPDSFTDALEIVGNVNLEKNSVVVSMLLWNGEEILKAKLKTKEMAREQYEVVVDRDADIPVKPMDPVILEYGWGIDNYDISVFPVSWGKTRRLRMRYLIPASNIGGVNKIGYPHAFTSNATVTFIKGAGIDGFKIESGNNDEKYIDYATYALSEETSILPSRVKFWLPSNFLIHLGPAVRISRR